MKRTTDDPGRSQHTRRGALAVIGAASTGGLAGCTTGLFGGQSELDRQIKTVREATAQYQDPKQALADGFVAGGPYVPGMGWHWQHPERGRKVARTASTSKSRTSSRT